MKKYRLHHFLFRVFTLKWRVMGLFGMQSIGVRILVEKENRILFIKHTYTPDWYLPGGGVNRSESPLNAAKRELIEEAGLVAHNLKLMGIYHNPRFNRDDYVVLYTCTAFDQVEKQPCHEIAEIKWFDKDNLPKDISPGTLRRILEHTQSQKISSQW